MRIRSRRYVALLEVLIAFVLVVLCILPLIYPHVAIYREERQFIDTVKLDHNVSLLYAHILQKLYQKTIPFGDLENKTKHIVDEKLWQEAGVEELPPFEGFYEFSIAKKRLLKPIPKVFLVNVDFIFKRKGSHEEVKELKYHYVVPVERKVPEAEEEEAE